MKIVSLIASATEIVCALGLREHLVGISHECDFPADIAGLPVLSAPQIDCAARGAEIDRQVRSRTHAGLSLYRIDTERLAALAPDVIVTQDQCKVCAVSLSDVEAAVCQLTHKPTRICTLSPHTLADVYADFERVGAATGVPERGRALAQSLKQRLANLAANTAETEEADRPRIACLEWLEPPMVAGGWMPDLVRAAGGRPVLVEETGPFRTVAWEELRAADPDVVALLPCGYGLEKSLSELADPALSRELGALRAIKSGRAFVCDGNAYFNRPGPRLADSAEILAALLYPERYGAEAAAYDRGFLPWVP